VYFHLCRLARCAACGRAWDAATLQDAHGPQFPSPGPAPGPCARAVWPQQEVQIRAETPAGPFFIPTSWDMHAPPLVSLMTYITVYDPNMDSEASITTHTIVFAPVRDHQRCSRWSPITMFDPIQLLYTTRELSTEWLYVFTGPNTNIHTPQKHCCDRATTR
jgi:hypothetical protein